MVHKDPARFLSNLQARYAGVELIREEIKRLQAIVSAEEDVIRGDVEAELGLDLATHMIAVARGMFDLASHRPAGARQALALVGDDGLFAAAVADYDRSGSDPASRPGADPQVQEPARQERSSIASPSVASPGHAVASTRASQKPDAGQATVMFGVTIKPENVEEAKTIVEAAQKDARRGVDKSPYRDSRGKHIWRHKLYRAAFAASVTEREAAVEGESAGAQTGASETRSTEELRESADAGQTPGARPRSIGGNRRDFGSPAASAPSVGLSPDAGERFDPQVPEASGDRVFGEPDEDPDGWRARMELEPDPAMYDGDQGYSGDEVPSFIAAEYERSNEASGQSGARDGPEDYGGFPGDDPTDGEMSEEAETGDAGASQPVRYREAIAGNNVFDQGGQQRADAPEFKQYGFGKHAFGLHRALGKRSGVSGGRT